jgi:hypothetical protein
LILESGGPTEILFALSGVALANVMLVGSLTLVSKALVSELRPVFGDATGENR